MSTRWDLTAYNRDNQLVLVVEVKSKLGATPQWAAQLRRNILAHGTFPNAPYFLMVFPDRFYLWKNTKSNHELIEPTYVIDARPILQPYFEQAGIIADQVSGQSLELIVASWLGEVMHKTSDELAASQQWLIDSGLYGAIVGGSLDHEVVV
jgi:hypothetical protein